jgi:YfiH family protein
MHEISLIFFSSLKKFSCLSHGVFLRNGGVSKPPFSSLNIGLNTGDDLADVQKNRDLISELLKVPTIVFPSQTHGVICCRVTDENKREEIVADGLYTTTPEIGIGIAHADCQAALFYDPVHQAIAAVHCGWRGSVQNIYAKMIGTLGQEIGTKPQDLIVCISPSLGPDHAEYKNYKEDFPTSFWDFQVRSDYFDFWAISQKQLIDSGVEPTNIEIMRECSFCEVGKYFSYRREKRTGRNCTVISLKTT